MAQTLAQAQGNTRFGPGKDLPSTWIETHATIQESIAGCLSPSRKVTDLMSIALSGSKSTVDNPSREHHLPHSRPHCTFHSVATLLLCLAQKLQTQRTNDHRHPPRNREKQKTTNKHKHKNKHKNKTTNNKQQTTNDKQSNHSNHNNNGHKTQNQTLLRVDLPQAHTPFAAKSSWTVVSACLDSNSTLITHIFQPCMCILVHTFHKYTFQCILTNFYLSIGYGRLLGKQQASLAPDLLHWSRSRSLFSRFARLSLQ